MLINLTPSFCWSNWRLLPAIISSRIVLCEYLMGCSFKDWFQFQFKKNCLLKWEEIYLILRDNINISLRYERMTLKPKGLILRILLVRHICIWVKEGTKYDFLYLTGTIRVCFKILFYKSQLIVGMKLYFNLNRNGCLNYAFDQYIWKAKNNDAHYSIKAHNDWYLGCCWEKTAIMQSGP